MGTLPFAVRQFRNWEEVIAEADFTPDAPVDSENYAVILGHYELKEDVRCCRRKPNGNLCATKHRDGYVVKTKDGIATIVGNECAATKFGEQSQISQHAILYQNELLITEKVVRFGELYARREQILFDIAERCARVRELKQRIGFVRGGLGPRSIARIAEMRRIGKADVEVTFYTEKAVPNRDGSQEVESTRAHVSLGRLQALELLDMEAYSGVESCRLRVISAFQAAEKYHGNPRNVKFAEAVTRVADYPRCIERANQLLALEERFELNDFSLLCYLTRDRDERRLAAGVCLSKAGQSGGSADADRLLRDMDSRLIERHRASRLQIE